MSFPANLKYTKSHEWVKDLGGGVFEIGLSSFAIEKLGDVVYVNLPRSGDEIKAQTSLGEVESVKAVSDIISPINGTVKEVNETIVSSPEALNKTPYESWLLRAEGAIGEELLSAEEYKKFCSL